MSNWPERTCKACGVSFTPLYYNQQYHDLDCRAEYHRAHKPTVRIPIEKARELRDFMVDVVEKGERV